MNFVGLSLQLQVEVSQENPGAVFDIAPEKRPNHPQQMRVILYSRPSGIGVGKRAVSVQDALEKALETIERHVPQEWEKAKRHFRLPALPDVQADDLMDMGILLGKVYDEKIIDEMLAQGAESYSG
jgi:hypothetical protein